MFGCVIPEPMGCEGCFGHVRASFRRACRHRLAPALQMAGANPEHALAVTELWRRGSLQYDSLSVHLEFAGLEEQLLSAPGCPFPFHSSSRTRRPAMEEAVGE